MTNQSPGKEVFNPWPNFRGSNLALESLLSEIFSPKSAFSSPKTELDFSLEASCGIPMADVLDEVREKVISHAIHSRHEFTMAHMMPPPATISAVADLLIGVMNQCAFIWEEAPTAKAVESEVIRWMLKRVGYTSKADGQLTSGGTMSNFLACYIAYQQGLEKWPNAKERFCIVASDQAHFSIQKAAKLLGLGSNAVVRVETLRNGRLRPRAINETTSNLVNSGMKPFIIICTAGTTNAGAVEAADDFLQAAHSSQAWCHMDAAHGGLLCLRERGGPEVSQWAKADSISWDPHKTLYVSYSSGALLLRDGNKFDAMAFTSEYALKHDDENDNAGERHFEGSRRFEALKIWMTIKNIGLQGYSKIADHSVLLAAKFAELVHEQDQFELLTEPDTNIVCFRFVAKGFDDSELNLINKTVQKQLFISGGPLVSTTMVMNRVFLRVVLLNPLLGIDRLPDVMALIHREALVQFSLLQPKKRTNIEDIACHQPPPGSRRFSETA